MAIDYFTPKFMMAVVEKFPPNKTYIGTNYGALGFSGAGDVQQGGISLFPPTQVSAYELTWDVIQAENQLAGVYAVDGEIKPGDETKLDTLFTEVCRIGSSRVVKEGDVMTLREAGTSVFDNRTMNDIRRKAESELRLRLQESNSETNATIEYFCLNALQGQLVWPPAALPNPPGFAQTNFTINWTLGGSGNISALTGGAGIAWSTVATANPVTDLQAIALDMENHGVPINDSQLTIICSQQVLQYLANNTVLRNALQYTNPGFLDFTQVRRYFMEVLGHTIVPYGATYSYRTYSADGKTYTSTRTRFLGANQVIIFPSAMAGELGDLAVAPSMANNWNASKFTWRTERTNPWVVEVGVGINCFPRLKHPEAVYSYAVNA